MYIHSSRSIIIILILCNNYNKRATREGGRGYESTILRNNGSINGVYFSSPSTPLSASWYMVATPASPGTTVAANLRCLRGRASLRDMDAAAALRPRIEPSSSVCTWPGDS